jgi:hypothetical protein
MLIVMDRNVTALERAFQLAKSGGVVDLRDIRARLRREGYDEKAVDGGPSLTSQLKGLIKIARSEIINVKRR